MGLDGSYDPRADVAWLRFDDYDPRGTVDEVTDSGLREFDPPTGRTVGVQVRRARQNLPAEFLQMLQRAPENRYEESHTRVGVRSHPALAPLHDAWG